MGMNENKYHSTVKLEFRDLIDNMVHRSRSVFHMYTIHRLLSLGLLIDFTYDYVKNSTPDKYIGIELNLKEHGRVLFKVDTDSNYGSVADEIGMKILENFLNNFDTGLDDMGQKGTLGI